MNEYRVMKVEGAFVIQQKEGKQWEDIGEFDDIEAAKKMVHGLRSEDE